MKYLISVIIAISLLMVSCSEDSPTEGKSTEIKVGVLLSLTGDGASLGETARAAIEYAKHEIDDFVYLAGSEYSFNVIIEDTETDTAVALQKLRGFAAQGINIVIGPQTSAEAAHIKAYADSNDILLVSPTSVAISLAIPNDNLFRLPTADNIQAEAMAALMRQDGIDRVVAVVRDDVWGRDLMNSFQDKFRGMGGDIHYAYFYDPA
ncbi:MAG: ABC transporter substrate-binding protein, partial [Candidatus Kapaibacterium sp.]